MKQYLLKLAKYNVWSCDRMFEMLKGLDPKQLNDDMNGSFGSIAKTIQHILMAQVVWDCRINSKKLPEWLSDKSIIKSNTQLQNELIESCNSFIQLINSRNESEMNATIEYNDLKGNPYKNEFIDIILHVMNHGTFHRGQVVNMLRQLGVNDLIATDFILFSR